jgi:hypothetical protein
MTDFEHWMVAAVIIMFINAQDLSCVACATAHLGLSLVIHEFGWVDDICSAALSLSVILLATFEAVPPLAGAAALVHSGRPCPVSPLFAYCCSSLWNHWVVGCGGHVGLHAPRL